MQGSVQGNQQKGVNREQKMTLNMRNIWKREMQNTTDGIRHTTRRKEQMEDLKAKPEIRKPRVSLQSVNNIRLESQ